MSDHPKPDHDAIERLAYDRWVARGSPHGSAEEDWLAAEYALNVPPVAPSAVDESSEQSFPASDPPASHLPDVVPVNARLKQRSATRQ